MAYGQGDAKSGAMNQHREMAGAGSSGTFGVKGLPQKPVPHPAVHEAMSPPMEDSMRAAPPARGGKQAAPDHAEGAGIKDHFTRAGKV